MKLHEAIARLRWERSMQWEDFNVLAIDTILAAFDCAEDERCVVVKVKRLTETAQTKRGPVAFCWGCRMFNSNIYEPRCYLRIGTKKTHIVLNDGGTAFWEPRTLLRPGPGCPWYEEEQ